MTRKEKKTLFGAGEQKQEKTVSEKRPAKAEGEVEKVASQKNISANQSGGKKLTRREQDTFFETL